MVFPNSNHINVTYGDHTIGIESDQLEKVDLFDYPELVPDNIKGILDSYENGDELDYELCRQLVAELEQNGYTADYGLDAIPFGLKKL